MKRFVLLLLLLNEGSNDGMDGYIAGVCVIMNGESVGFNAVVLNNDWGNWVGCVVDTLGSFEGNIVGLVDGYAVGISDGYLDGTFDGPKVYFDGLLVFTVGLL
eukprot:CAMPEP_0114680034 /NCGR_PEP_ID=MMETSP0191-20121206/53617_1 /TAXON_ID=126664 /ORGANISM="Sorites sp." /LENGTH=102 /DNA_ID=CAMNT_0001956199 /DNA_START=273 /DNA_END=578 /DNA_ORIENTATION=-